MGALGAPWAARRGARADPEDAPLRPDGFISTQRGSRHRPAYFNLCGRFRENLLEKMEKKSLFLKEILAIKLKLEEITHTIRVEQGLKPWLKIGISRSFKKYRVLAWESPA